VTFIFALPLHPPEPAPDLTTNPAMFYNRR